MQIRRLNIDDLHVGALDDFDRAQETATIRVLVDGKYTEVPLSYVEDWDVDKRRDIVRELRKCVEDGGVAVGAVEHRALFGFANVVAARFGSNRQYVEMPYLHVSRELRGQGAGRELFGLAVEGAKALGESCSVWPSKGQRLWALPSSTSPPTRRSQRKSSTTPWVACQPKS